MAKHKTAHRKALEAHNREQSRLRAEVVAELASGDSLKSNARANAPKPKAPAPAPAPKAKS
jgi:hypothetical protein